MESSRRTDGDEAVTQTGSERDEKVKIDMDPEEALKILLRPRKRPKK